MKKKTKSQPFYKSMLFCAYVSMIRKVLDNSGPFLDTELITNPSKFKGTHLGKRVFNEVFIAIRNNQKSVKQGEHETFTYAGINFEINHAMNSLISVSKEDK